MNSKTLSCRRLDAVAWLFVFAVHAVTVTVLASKHSLISCEDAYINLAENLVKHGSFHLDFPSYWHASGQLYTHFAPGWPFLLAIGYAVAGLTGCWVMMWLVWCVNSVLAYGLAVTLGLAERWRWALVGWVTLNPLFLFYHGHLMTESAVIGYILALTALGIRLVESPTVWRVTLFAAVAAAAHITRSQTMLAVIAVWLVGAVTIRWRRLIPLVLLFAVVHIWLLSPWLWRMNRVAGTPFSTELKLGINLYMFSGTDVADPYGPGGGDFPLPAGIERMTPQERNSVFIKEALKHIISRKKEYINRCLSRSFYLFSPVPNFYKTNRLQYFAILAASLAFFHTFLLAAVVGLIRRRPRSSGAWVLVAALGIWFAFHIMINASIRNRLPSDVWVAALAIVTWIRPAAKSAHCRVTLTDASPALQSWSPSTTAPVEQESVHEHDLCQPTH